MMSNACEHCVDLKPILFDLNLGLTTEFLLGESAVSSVEDKSLMPSLWADNLTKELKTAFKWIAKRERLKTFFWMIDSKEFRASCKAARELVDEIIARMFLAIEDENPSKESYVALKPLFREQVDGGLIRDQFLTLLLAGRDTSGSLLCWTLYSLAREPDLVLSLKAEIASILGPGSQRLPTKAELKKMAKLDQFITESTCRRVSLLSTMR
jgi:cytochrome P450